MDNHKDCNVGSQRIPGRSNVEQKIISFKNLNKKEPNDVLYIYFWQYGDDGYGPVLECPKCFNKNGAISCQKSNPKFFHLK